MPNPSLRDYLDRCRAADPDQVWEVTQPIPRDFLVTAMALELERQKRYPILYFSRVSECDIPVVANIFASRQRIAELLGAREGELSSRWLEIERALLPPRLVPSGPVKEVIEVGDEVDVRRYPVMAHFPTDAGRYITSGVIISKDPDTGIRNLSYARIFVKSANRLGISLHSRQHLYHHFCRAEEEGKALEVAVVIGAHPAVLLAAAAKPGIHVDECDIAGSILGEPLELVAGESVAIEYPATAEIVLEGRLLPGVREPEGPFGEFTGYSTSRSTENVFEVTAVCRRKRPLYLSVVPGPSSDHLLLARVAREAAVFHRLSERIPAIRAIHYPRSGVNFHCYISLARAPEGTARHALLLLFGLDPYVKLAVAVDDDIDVTDEEAVWWAVATRVQGDRDIIQIPRVWMIPLDPSSINGMSTKVGIDATLTEEMRREITVCREDPQQLALARCLIAEHAGAEGHL